MCIAISNSAGSTLKQEWIKNSWDNNGDGAGLLWLQDGKLNVFKEMDSFVSYWEKYLEVRSTCPESNILLHFRISTHGKINHTNCHPFLVDETIGFIHNGMIHQVERHEDFSDTFMFNETILKGLPKGWQYNPVICELINEYIDSNKLVFLDTNNVVTIINEKAGHWVGSDWFSNTSYQRYNDWYDFGGVKKSKTIGYTATPTTSNSKWNDWRDWESPTQSTGETCKDCGIALVVGEIDYCEQCEEDRATFGAPNDDDEFDYEWSYVGHCECCDTPDKLVMWDSNFKATICVDCHEDVYTYVKPEPKKDEVETISLSQWGK